MACARLEDRDAIGYGTRGQNEADLLLNVRGSECTMVRVVIRTVLLRP